MAATYNKNDCDNVPDACCANDFEYDGEGTDWSKGSPYDTSVICTYMFPDDVFTKKEMDELTDNEKTYVMDVIYRAQFLSIFRLKPFDADLVDRNMVDFENAFSAHPKLKMMLTEFGVKMYSVTLESAADRTPTNLVRCGFAYAMSWQMMYYTHPCIVAYFTTGCVSDELIERAHSAFERDPCWQA